MNALYYCEPKCYELSGQVLSFSFDGDFRQHIHFHENMIIWQTKDEILSLAYTCQKLGDGIFCIDSEQMILVTDFTTGFVAMMRNQAQADTLLVGHMDTMVANDYMPSHDLDGHMISWLVAPGKRLPYRYGVDARETVLRMREDRYLLLFPVSKDCVMLLAVDVYCLRGVGVVWCKHERTSHPVAAYGAFVRDADESHPDYRIHMLGKSLYNPISRCPMLGGLRQYNAPVTVELKEKEFGFHIDTLGAVKICFCTDNQLIWMQQGEPTRHYAYACTKGDDNTYFIIVKQHPEEAASISLVWDRAAGAVTVVMAEVGKVPGKPRLVTQTVHHGGCDGMDAAVRHHRTSDLAGKRVIWTYNPNDEIMHIYMTDTLFRLGMWEGIPSCPPTEADQKTLAWLNERRANYPCYEESAWYLKINDRLYLYSVTEANLNRCLPLQGGNNLLILLNIEQVRYTGRCFGRGRRGELEDMRIGGIGRFSDVSDAVESLPVPFYTFYQ